MAQTAIPTITTGDIATAAWGNTYLRDNEAAHWAAIVALQASVLALVTNPPRCRLNRTTDWNSTTSLTNITWETEEYDSNTMFDAGAATRITIATAGLYLVIGQATWTSGGTAGGYRHIGVYVNGNTGLVVCAQTVPFPASGVLPVNISGIYDLAAADYIQMKTQSAETDSMDSANISVIRLM